MRPCPKPEPPLRDPEYLAWVRGQPCLVHGRRCRPGAAGSCDAAHMEGGGAIGRKGPDDRTVPLCHDLHMEEHKGGRRTFEAKYEVDLIAAAITLRERYLRITTGGST